MVMGEMDVSIRRNGCVNLEKRVNQSGETGESIKRRGHIIVKRIGRMLWAYVMGVCYTPLRSIVSFKPEWPEMANSGIVFHFLFEFRKPKWMTSFGHESTQVAHRVHSKWWIAPVFIKSATGRDMGHSREHFPQALHKPGCAIKRREGIRRRSRMFAPIIINGETQQR